MHMYIYIYIHIKQSILGYPHLWKPPFEQLTSRHTRSLVDMVANIKSPNHHQNPEENMRPCIISNLQPICWQCLSNYQPIAGRSH